MRDELQRVALVRSSLPAVEQLGGGDADELHTPAWQRRGQREGGSPVVGQLSQRAHERGEVELGPERLINRKYPRGPAVRLLSHPTARPVAVCSVVCPAAHRERDLPHASADGPRLKLAGRLVHLVSVRAEQLPERVFCRGGCFSRPSSVLLDHRLPLGFDSGWGSVRSYFTLTSENTSASEAFAISSRGCRNSSSIRKPIPTIWAPSFSTR